MPSAPQWQMRFRWYDGKRQRIIALCKICNETSKLNVLLMESYSAYAQNRPLTLQAFRKHRVQRWADLQKQKWVDSKYISKYCLSHSIAQSLIIQSKFIGVSLADFQKLEALTLLGWLTEVYSLRSVVTDSVTSSGTYLFPWLKNN